MNAADDALALLKGKYCWGIDWDSQTNLALSFGEPHLEIREPIQAASGSERVRRSLAHRRVLARGEYWLWIYLAYWTVTIPTMDPVRGSSSKRRIHEALRLLAGQKLTVGSLDSQSGRTQLVFDLGATLSIRPATAAADDDVWTLYGPAKRCFSVNSKRQFRDGRCDAKPPWQPLREAPGK